MQIITCNDNYGKKVTIAREKFQFRPSVYGIIRNSGKICICKTKSTGKIWFPGGGIDRGESRMTALRREIKEETGLADVQIGNLIGSFENFFYRQPTDEAMHAFLFFYECATDEWDLYGNDKVNDGEATDFQWIEMNQLRKKDLTDLNEELFQMIRSIL